MTEITPALLAEIERLDEKPLSLAWREAGGTFYGPHVEHADMEYDKWRKFMEPLWSALPALARRVGELEDLVEALKISEETLNRAVRSEVDLRNRVYTERVQVAEARATAAEQRRDELAKALGEAHDLIMSSNPLGWDDINARAAWQKDATEMLARHRAALASLTPKEPGHE